MAGKVVIVHFLLVDQPPYNIIICNRFIKGLKGVLDAGNRFALFTINGDEVHIPMKPNYVHEEASQIEGTDSEVFTPASSAEDSSKKSIKENFYNNETGFLDLTINLFTRK